jgi:site-specific recombinase XerD
MNAEVRAALRKIEKRGQYVFFNRETRKNIKDIKGPFRTAKIRAKIKGRLRVHDLRHTAASWMIEDGTDIMTVKEILGHASVITTQRYCHPTRETKRRAVMKLSDRLNQNKADILVDIQAKKKQQNTPACVSYAYN